MQELKDNILLNLPRIYKLDWKCKENEPIRFRTNVSSAAVDILNSIWSDVIKKATSCTSLDYEQYIGLKAEYAGKTTTISVYPTTGTIMFQGNGCLSWLDKHINIICNEVGKEIENLKEKFSELCELSLSDTSDCNEDISSLVNDEKNSKQMTQCDLSKCTGIIEKEAHNLSTYFCKSCNSVYDHQTNDLFGLSKTPDTYKLTLNVKPKSASTPMDYKETVNIVNKDVSILELKSPTSPSSTYLEKIHNSIITTIDENDSGNSDGIIGELKSISKAVASSIKETLSQRNWEYVKSHGYHVDTYNQSGILTSSPDLKLSTNNKITNLISPDYSSLEQINLEKVTPKTLEETKSDSSIKFIEDSTISSKSSSSIIENNNYFRTINRQGEFDLITFKPLSTKSSWPEFSNNENNEYETSNHVPNTSTTPISYVMDKVAPCVSKEDLYKKDENHEISANPTTLSKSTEADTQHESSSASIEEINNTQPENTSQHNLTVTEIIPEDIQSELSMLNREKKELENELAVLKGKIQMNEEITEKVTNMKNLKVQHHRLEHKNIKHIIKDYTIMEGKLAVMVRQINELTKSKLILKNLMIKSNIEKMEVEKQLENSINQSVRNKKENHIMILMRQKEKIIEEVNERLKFQLEQKDEKISNLYNLLQLSNNKADLYESEVKKLQNIITKQEKQLEQFEENQAKDWESIDSEDSDILDIEPTNKNSLRSGNLNTCMEQRKTQTKKISNSKLIDMNLKSMKSKTVQSDCIIEMPSDEELNKSPALKEPTKSQSISENTTKQKRTNSLMKYRPICKYYMSNKCYSRKCIYLHPIYKNAINHKPVSLLTAVSNPKPSLDLSERNASIIPTLITNESTLLDYSTKAKNIQDAPSNSNTLKIFGPVSQHLTNTANYSANVVPSQYNNNPLISGYHLPNASHNYQINEIESRAQNMYDYPNYIACSSSVIDNNMNVNNPVAEDFVTSQIYPPNTSMPPPVLQPNPANDYSKMLLHPALSSIPCSVENQSQVNQTFNLNPANILEKQNSSTLRSVESSLKPRNTADKPTCKYFLRRSGCKLGYFCRFPHQQPANTSN